MHVTADRLHLSPSDVTAFLACEHLTTLSLAHARGELERPEVENEQAELIFRKGLEHERAYLDSLRAEGLTVLEIEDPRGDYEGAARATADAILAGEADVIYQGVLAGEGWRGVADFLLRQPDGTYEALDTKLARSAKPAYILQLLFYNEQLARIQGHEPERIHVLLGSGEQASFRPEEFAAYYRRVRSRLEEFVADPPPTEPYPGLALLDLRVQADLRRALGRGRPPQPRRRDSADADREARRRRDRHARATGERSRGAGAGRVRRGRLGAAARAGGPPAPPARDGRGALGHPEAAARVRLRAPPRPVAGRPLLRLRGEPVLGLERRARVPLGDPRRGRRVHAAPRARSRHRAARVRDVRRSRARATRARPRPARLPLRPVRDHGAQAADGALRDARSGARRPAPAGRLRRSLQGRPQRRPRVGAGLWAEGAGGLSRLPARGRGEGRRRLDRRLRAVDADGRAGAPGSDRRVQPRGLPRDAAPARLAARAARARTRRVRAVPAARAQGAEARARAAGRAGSPSRRAPRRGARARRPAPRLPRP